MKLADLIPKGLLKDEHDAIALLEADHDKVTELFDHFEDLKDSRADKEKEAIVAEACRELTIHTALEEEVFYPAVRGALRDEDLMNEAIVEHDGAKALIRELLGMEAGDAMFNAKFTVLAEYTKHHIKEEHEEMFPKVRATSVDLKALGERMLAHKQQLEDRAIADAVAAKAKPARKAARMAASKKPAPPARRKPRAGKGEARAAR